MYQSPLPLPRASYLTDRGPFSTADDRALMCAHDIDTMIAKNSGGAATYSKIAAARALGIEVIMLRRPTPPSALAVETADEVIAWLGHTLASAKARGTARGV